MIRYALFAVSVLLVGLIIGLVIAKLLRPARAAQQRPAHQPVPGQSPSGAQRPLWPGIIGALMFVAAAMLALAAWLS